jgi:hypothetical protein
MYDKPQLPRKAAVLENGCGVYTRVTTCKHTSYTLPSAINMHLSPQGSLGERVCKTISGLALSFARISEVWHWSSLFLSFCSSSLRLWSPPNLQANYLHQRFFPRKGRRSELKVNNSLPSGVEVENAISFISASHMSSPLLLVFIYFNCKWVFTRWQWSTIRHNTQITHIPQNNTPPSNKTHHTKLHKQWRTHYTQWIQCKCNYNCN